MKSKSSFSWELFHRMPVVGIVRGWSMEQIRMVADACQQSGFYTLEVTMNTQGAVEIIDSLKQEYPDLNIGAGTVCNTRDLTHALKAGAQFIVTPILDRSVVEISVSESIPIFPGAYTPTEIYQAWELGASAVKVFPASQLGVSYVKELLAPLNEIKLLPTGGVSLENIRSFFEAGAYGVGMGGALFDKNLVKAGNLNALCRHLENIKKEITNFLNSA